MTNEIITAIQLALSKQFDAGKAVGALEMLISKSNPEPTGNDLDEAIAQPPKDD